MLATINISIEKKIDEVKYFHILQLIIKSCEIDNFKILKISAKFTYLKDFGQELNILNGSDCIGNHCVIG